MLAENDFPKMASVHVSIQTSFVRLNALNVSTVQHGNDKYSIAEVALFALAM